MQNSARLRFWAALCALLALHPRLDGEEAPDADAVLRRFMSATRAAELVNHSFMTAEGRIVSIAQNFEGAIRVSKARPARLLIEVRLDGYGTVRMGFEGRMGFDGQGGWQSEPNTPLRRLPAAGAAELRDEADFLPVNHSPERVRSVRLSGRSTVDQTPCDRVVVVRSDGTEIIEEYSVATGLLVARSKPDQTIELFGDYRKFGGVLLPTRVETRRGGRTEQIVTIARVSFDPIAEDVFRAERYDFKYKAGFLPAAVRNTPGPLDAVDDKVCRAMDELGIPGLALAVLREGSILKAAGYGMADLAARAPVTIDTVFEIGSMTKVFTATIVLQLAREKRLELDDSLEKRLPDCPEAWRPITVRQLLTHTSGLRQSVVWGTLFREIPDGELIARAAKLPPAFEPGDNWGYSNIGYQLLGAVISRAAGTAWPEVMRARIFAPLGMTKTERMSASAKAVPRAVGYSLAEDGGLKPGLHDPSGTAAGSALSTVLDLARWDAALYGDAILDQKTLSAMWQRTRSKRGEVAWYGTGWFVAEFMGQKVVYHGGDTISGFTSLLMRFPDRKLTVILLCNRVGVDKQRLGRSIAEEYLPVLSGEKR